MPYTTLPTRATRLDPDPEKDLQPLKTGETHCWVRILFSPSFPTNIYVTAQ